MIRHTPQTLDPQTRPGVGLFTPLTLFLGIATLFLERQAGPSLRPVVELADYVLLFLLVADMILKALRARSFASAWARHSFDIVFLAVFVPLFVLAKYASYSSAAVATTEPLKAPAVIIILRGFFVVLRITSRLGRLTAFVRGVTLHPARTVTASFALVIVSGMVFLMQPFATADGRGLPLLDALFTATSAVCVTGLIVVDTATVFSPVGKLIVLVLIQIGGLGIMILSYFAAYATRRALSMEDKLLVAYLLNERDARNLRTSLRRVVFLTLGIEAAGALLLYPTFAQRFRPLDALGLSAFHAVSAFCNAGFALFTNSLEDFVSRPGLNVVICLLIVSGGLGFSVLPNVARTLLGRKDARGRSEQLTLNTRILLRGTALLVVGGAFLFYLLEHGNSLRELNTGTQYLAAFFQSVTLRTAGFNTVGMGALRPVTYLVMMVFMFIGAGAGSTAGGIKINAVAVMAAHLRAAVQERSETVLGRYVLARELVGKSFLILVFGLLAVSVGGALIAAVENGALVHLLFETVSAFGTVGLSAGVTSQLTIAGKLTIVLLMFMGRVGPLTLLAAASRGRAGAGVRHPQGEVVLG